MHIKKNISRLLCLLLAAIMMLACGSALLMTAGAETPSEKLQRLEKEKIAIEESIKADANNVKKAVQTKAAYAKKAEIERQQLELLGASIQATQASLEEKKLEIEQKILDIQVTKDTFEKRMVSTYVNKDRSSLSALLAVKDFSQLLRVGENIKAIARHDTEMLEMLREQQAQLEEMRAQIEAQLAELEAQQAERERLKAQYEQSMIKAQQQADAAAASKAANEAAYADFIPKYEAGVREWEAWVAQDSQGGEFIGGVFSWPVPGYTRINSGFGERRIIYGKVDIHRGIDIPAPAGTPVYAAATGTASTMGHHWTYGKCVKISHGGGVVSVYAHMSAIAAGVSEGVAITKGQLIGYVGSTGNSTGNHLHFEVDKNGAPVNPAGYLQG
ncbi:MAG: peptidoglycan DD-metalloendopeptidase family protein [Oscillospiraceae bacterium]